MVHLFWSRESVLFIYDLVDGEHFHPLSSLSARELDFIDHINLKSKPFFVNCLFSLNFFFGWIITLIDDQPSLPSDIYPCCILEENFEYINMQAHEFSHRLLSE